MGHTLENKSRLQKWATFRNMAWAKLRKMGHTYKNRLPVEKWVTL